MSYADLMRQHANAEAYFDHDRNHNYRMEYNSPTKFEDRKMKEEYNVVCIQKQKETEMLQKIWDNERRRALVIDTIEMEMDTVVLKDDNYTPTIGGKRSREVWE